MTLKDIHDSLQCSLHFGPPLWEQRLVRHCAAGDLMSEVLVNEGEQILLVTSLTTEQVVRTADIVEATAILLVNGKIPPREVCSLAADISVPLLSTNLNMYQACVALSGITGSAEAL